MKLLETPVKIITKEQAKLAREILAKRLKSAGVKAAVKKPLSRTAQQAARQHFIKMNAHDMSSQKRSNLIEAIIRHTLG